MKYITFLMLLVPFTTFGYDWCRLGGLPEDNSLSPAYTFGMYKCFDNNIEGKVILNVSEMESSDYIIGQIMDNRVRSENVLFGVVEYYGITDDSWYTCTVPMDDYVDTNGKRVKYKNVLPH